jgi:hypothetical protein
VTGLEVLLLGRISGDVDPGGHTGRGEADGARWQCRRGWGPATAGTMRAAHEGQ